MNVQFVDEAVVTTVAAALPAVIASVPTPGMVCITPVVGQFSVPCPLTYFHVPTNALTSSEPPEEPPSPPVPAVVDEQPMTRRTQSAEPIENFMRHFLADHVFRVANPVR